MRRTDRAVAVPTGMRSAGRCRAAALLVTATLLLSIALSGCTAARNALGTPVSSCFHALPVAADAVQHHGRFAGVRLVSITDLSRHRRLSSLAAVVAARAGTDRSVCVVTFRGSFTGGDVADPIAAPAGATRSYALVVVATPADRLLGTALVAKPPWTLRDLV